MSNSTEPLESLKKKILSPTVAISTDLPRKYVNNLIHFFSGVGTTAVIPDHCDVKDIYSDVITGVLKPLRIERGSVSCLLTVKPSILNHFKTIHRGAIAAIAEAISIACARTVFAENQEIFLGELSISYLSGATENAEVMIEAKVVRKGRNVTVVGVEFRLKKTQKLIYQTRATFYNMPSSKLLKFCLRNVFLLLLIHKTHSHF